MHLAPGTPQDNVLEIVLLKRHRRGNYADGETNATTFWPCVVRGAGSDARLALEQAPLAYYRTAWEGQEEERTRQAARPRRRQGPAVGPDPAVPAVGPGPAAPAAVGTAAQLALPTAC